VLRHHGKKGLQSPDTDHQIRMESLTG
jgi:hypothetical protein